MKDSSFQLTRLDNGIRVISESLPLVGSVSIGIWLNVGSRYEESDLAGASHFIEHMLFKGTRLRSARDIAEQVDAVGGQMNAFTSREYTCYYARLLGEHLGLAVEILADMIRNSLFDPGELDKERSVILEEIRLYEDSPDELVHDVFARTLWQHHTLGRPVLGEREVVATLDRDSLLAYRDQFYRPNNMVVSAAGNVDHHRLVQMIENQFGDLEPGGMIPQDILPDPGTEFVVVDKPVEQVHLCIGASAVPFGHERFPALSMLGTMLGGGPSSRLFQRIREEHGLAYAVYSYETGFRDTGMFVVYAGTGQDQVARTLELTLSELQAVIDGDISEAEVDRARQQLRGGLLLGMENMNIRMNRMGRWLLMRGKVEPVSSVLSAYERVTPEHLRALASDLISRSRLTAALVGPVSDEVRQQWNG